ncbi:MAG: extracellular solute-binding protein [Chloroflexi bacterium]|nr:MAG: extracellular solute-binding protein [Chloroflexota bacterium]RPI96691.1 MAG: extracellular solute-binding protein [Chloroflexota bacterium]
MKELHLALIGGPQYDGLLEKLPAFEEQTGYHLHVDVRLPHVELNERMAKDLGTADGCYDLISTHTKYSPSQAEYLMPFDELVSVNELNDFVPRVLDLCRIGDKLMQLPRNLDARILFYRADLIPAPQTWEEADAQMVAHKRNDLYGFAFPGRHSGLFGTFYEMLGMAGGDLFDDELHPVFNSEAGEWALNFLYRLHSIERVTPPDLIENWYYDEISERFRKGDVLMVGDWPGFYGLYQKRETCAVFGRFDVAVYPAGPAGIRKSYAGGHSFAIPKAARDPQGGAALAKYLTSVDVQWHEASLGGHTPVRQSIFEKMKAALAGQSAAKRDARRMAALEETINHYAMIPPKIPEYPLIEDIMASGVQEAVTGKQSPKEALLIMEKKVREVLL